MINCGQRSEPKNPKEQERKPKTITLWAVVTERGKIVYVYSQHAYAKNLVDNLNYRGVRYIVKKLEARFV